MLPTEAVQLTIVKEAHSMYLETSLSCTRIQTSASEPTGGFFGLLPQTSNNTASQVPLVFTVNCCCCPLFPLRLALKVPMN